MIDKKGKNESSLERGVIERISQLRENLLKIIFPNGKKELARKPVEKEAEQKIEDLKSKKLNEEIIVETNAVIKDYLKEKFNISQSLTYEETIEKLENKGLDETVKLDLFHLLVQINQKEYFPHSKMSIQEIENIINLASKILEDIEAYEKKSASSESGLKDNEDSKISQKRDGEKIEEKKKRSNESAEVAQLRKDIAPFIGGLKVDWRNEEVRKNYEKIREDYSRLNDEEKIEVYQQIIDIFKPNKN